MAELAVQVQLAQTLMKEIDKKSIISHENEWMENPETTSFLRFILHACFVLHHFSCPTSSIPGIHFHSL